MPRNKRLTNKIAKRLFTGDTARFTRFYKREWLKLVNQTASEFGAILNQQQVDELIVELTKAPESKTNYEHNTYKPLPVPYSMMPQIENALGIALTQEQKQALFNPDIQLFGGRRICRCVMHSIQIALSIGPPLALKTVATNFKASHFMRIYKEVANKLQQAGFDVRQVEEVGGWQWQK